MAALRGQTEVKLTTDQRVTVNFNGDARHVSSQSVQPGTACSLCSEFLVECVRV